MEKNWEEKYWEYIASNNIEAAMPLKENNFPSSFFKYKKLTKNSLESLYENYIWIAEISTLNDPFECSIQFDNNECLKHYYGSKEFRISHLAKTGHKLSKQDIQLLTTSKTPHEEFIKICKMNNIQYGLTSEQLLKKVQNRWGEIVNETNKKLRICSFSLVNDSLLLWSHYSNEHKGFCVEYDFLENDLIRPFIQPIIYRDKVHKVGIFEEYTIMQMIASSLIKSSDWQYEKEWRLTIFEQNDEFPHKIPAPNPKAIYLGTRFDLNETSLKSELINFSRKHKVPLIKMKKHPNEFRLIKDV